MLSRLHRCHQKTKHTHLCSQDYIGATRRLNTHIYVSRQHRCHQKTKHTHLCSQDYIGASRRLNTHIYVSRLHRCHQKTKHTHLCCQDYIGASRRVSCTPYFTAASPTSRITCLQVFNLLLLFLCQSHFPEVERNVMLWT